MKCVIVTADDFGLSEAVNEAVERAHRDGVLTSASLMVAGPSATDAVRRAKKLPSLRVGLHLVVVEGPAVLAPADIAALLGKKPSPNPLPPGDGWGEGARFPADQLALGLRYAFHPAARRQLAAEIRAQFAAFAATGLPLDHADAHKHMHLHPMVGRLLIDIGREHGLRAIRIPAEPPSVLAACGHPPRAGERALHAWSTLLRRQARRAGVVTNDHAFGIAWSGHMTATRLLRLAGHLPDGVSEVYLHPASRRDPILMELMPEYEHEAELAALLDPRVPAALAATGAVMTDFSQEVDRCRR